MNSALDLFGRAPFAVAHRGGAAEAPENTLKAFRRAIAAGFAFIECDVRALADGTPVVVHDASVRPAGAGEDVPVAGLSRRDWETVDLSAHLGAEAAGERPPTLRDVLALPFGATKLMIEVKPTADDLALGAAAAAAARATLGPSRCVLASFSAEVLEGVRTTAPDLALMALLDAETPWSSFARLPIAAAGIETGLVTSALVAKMQSEGVAVWSWTVKDLRSVEPLLLAGVRGLITDLPTAVSARLAR